MNKYARQPIADATAPGWAVSMLRDVIQWVFSMLRGPSVRNVYTLASLPDPLQWEGTILTVSDGSGALVVAVGGVWVYADGTPV